MENKDKFSTVISSVKKMVLRFLIVVITVAIILSSVHVVYLIFQHIIAPPYFLIEVTTLFEIFNLVLIIVIGYELIKSLLLLIYSEVIPVIPIIQIAIIAVANKIITLDLKNAGSGTVLSLAVLISALAVAHFLLKYHKPSQNELPG